MYSWERILYKWTHWGCLATISPAILKQSAILQFHYMLLLRWIKLDWQIIPSNTLVCPTISLRFHSNATLNQPLSRGGSVNLVLVKWLIIGSLCYEVLDLRVIFCPLEPCLLFTYPRQIFITSPCLGKNHMSWFAIRLDCQLLHFFCWWLCSCWYRWWWTSCWPCLIYSCFLGSSSTSANCFLLFLKGYSIKWTQSPWWESVCNIIQPKETEGIFKLLPIRKLSSHFVTMWGIGPCCMWPKILQKYLLIKFSNYYINHLNNRINYGYTKVGWIIAVEKYPHLRQ